MNWRSKSERLRALDARNAKDLGPSAEERRQEVGRWSRWRVDSDLAMEVGA